MPTFDPDSAEGIVHLQQYNEELWAENQALKSKILIIEEENERLREVINNKYGGPPSDDNTRTT